MAFLLAHVAYTVLFTGILLRSDMPVPIEKTILVLCGVPTLTGLMLLRVWGRLGVLKAPATLYTVAIMGMFLSGWLLPPTYWQACFGALLFVVSDAALAEQLFGKRRLPFHSQIIWWTYILGQSLILAGFA